MGDIIVWLIRIEDMADALARGGSGVGDVLSAGDWQYIHGQTDEARRRAAGATRLALRLALRDHLGVYEARQPIARGAGGKPLLPAGIGGFSISHTERSALIAVAAAGSVGIDLETRRDLSFSPERCQKIRSAAGAFGPAPLCDDVFGLLQGWTRLEAVAKARGSGIGQLLTDLGVWGPGHGARDAAEIAAAARRLIGAEGVSVHDLNLPPELFGSLAVIPGMALGEVPVRRVAASHVLG